MSTTDSPRSAGKRGVKLRQPIPEMQLALFRATAPAKPPAEGDVSHGITDWGMDDNDRLGDCGYAMSDHYVMAKTGDAQLVGTFGGGVSLYFEYGVAQGETGPADHPDQPDEGVDPPSWFNFLMDKGLIEAWAEIDAKDADEVHAAMLNFGGVAVAVDLNDSAESEFEAHQPWHLAPGEKADPNEGHFVLGVKYDPETETYVTWGGLQPATLDWDASCIVAVYVFVTKDDAERNGVDINALIAACRQHGGHVATGDAPPAPEPTPSDVPPAVESQTFVVQINDIANGTGWAEIPVLPSIVTAVATSAAPGITATAAPATDNPEETCITVTGVPAGISSLTVEVTFVEGAPVPS